MNSILIWGIVLAYIFLFTVFSLADSSFLSLVRGCNILQSGLKRLCRGRSIQRGRVIRLDDIVAKNVSSSIAVDGAISIEDIVLSVLHLRLVDDGVDEGLILEDAAKRQRGGMRFIAVLAREWEGIRGMTEVAMEFEEMIGGETQSGAAVFEKLRRRVGI